MKKKETPVMIHLTAGDQQLAAAILRVLVVPTDYGFFAQGLEIDYVATGSTETEVRERFATGFVETVRSYMQRERDLGSLFSKSKTPDEYWTAYYNSARRHSLTCAVRVDLTDSIPQGLPNVLDFCNAEIPKAPTLQYA